jgi:glycosyltransferase involved in cell wall biosynthesis
MELSVIIPYYHEPYLEKTINSLKENSVGEIEILPIEGSKGMRAAINEGISRSTGKFIMKVDAHCIFGRGFDKILTEDCKENWLMIPRRYSINHDWTRSDAKPYIDYHFLSYPDLFVINWVNRKTDMEIDGTMTFQGSCYLANREYFMNRVGYLDDNPQTYGTFAADNLEVGLKYWLGGDEVKVNKRTWYGHLFKNKQSYIDGIFNRDYKKGSQFKRNWAWVTDHWMNDKEPGMVRKLSWLVEKFKPVPTWP